MIQQLRIYEIFEDAKNAFHARFTGRRGRPALDETATRALSRRKPGPIVPATRAILASKPLRSFQEIPVPPL
jgi:hypothetical protein